MELNHKAFHCQKQSLHEGAKLSLLQGIKLDQGEGIVGSGSCMYGIRSSLDQKIERKGFVIITTRRILFYDFEGWLRFRHHYSFAIPLIKVRSFHTEMWVFPQLVISFEKPRAASSGFQGTIFDRDNTPDYLTAVIKKKWFIRHPVDIAAISKILQLLI